MRLLLLLVAVCAASAYVVVYRLDETGPAHPAFDVYAYFYPNILHAIRSLAAGGGGLLWNPFQNCGQPFLGITETGLFYPANVLFLVLDPETALRGVLFTNLLIGGFGAYGLGREIGVSPLAAIGAAVAFILASTTYNLTTWMPTVQAPFVWMPVAMLCCERLMKNPSLPRALLLGMALAAGLLPGHPQFVLFTCQLVALRLLWGALDRSERRHFVRAFGGVAMAMVVMLLLTAVQFLSSLQVIGESIRGAALHPEEIVPRHPQALAELALSVMRHDAAAPFNIVPAFLAAVAIVSAPRRRIALFYFLTGVLFFVLSFGYSTPLGELYFRLPIAALFREPLRFQFVTGFCVSVLTGLAIDTLTEGSWKGLAVAAAALAGLYAWVGEMLPMDWRLAGTVLGGGLLAAALPVARPIGVAAIVGTIVLAPVLAPTWSARRYLVDDRELYAHAAVFERLRQRLTPSDRVRFLLPRATNEAGFQEKTALLYQVPSVTDYEMQVSQRYAEYGTMMRRSELLRSLNQVHFPGPWNRGTISWPYVNLAAARYLVVAKSDEPSLDPNRGLHLRLLDGDTRISVYENPAALPRAYYVPQIAVEPNRQVRLQRLAQRSEDRRRLALVNAAPPAGFLGVPGNDATADARFVVDDPEHLVLETTAPERGFLFLADQYFPAWSATVNGQPVPIQVANHAFRLVEVPQGPVTVEFRYRSDRLRLGALVSGVTLLVVGAVLVSSWYRNAGSATRSPRQPPAGSV